MRQGLLGVAMVAGSLSSESHWDLDGLDRRVKRWFLVVCYYSCMIIGEVVMLPRGLALFALALAARRHVHALIRVRIRCQVELPRLLLIRSADCLLVFRVSLYLRSGSERRLGACHLDSEEAGGTAEKLIDNVLAAAGPGGVGSSARLDIGSLLVSTVVWPKDLTQAILRLQSLAE